MRVNILVSVPDPKYFEACTLCFDTLRVGFPTADINVWINPFQCVKEIEAKARQVGCMVNYCDKVVHHAAWIAERLYNVTGPMVILDPDTYFLESCEGWKFDTQLAGHYNPAMWNDFAQCRSVERLHTSFLWFSDPPELVRRINQVYPWCNRQNGDYCPCDPFMPAVRFVQGEPFFWDSCANLYNMVGGTAFGPEHFACYGHLNSSAFMDVMLERLGNPRDAEIFKWLHDEGLHALPRYHKLLWETTNRYYTNKAAQLKG